jgi:hypothetical protein
MSLHPEALRAKSLEVADIFRAYGEAYRSAYGVPLPHRRVMSAIEKCRTEALGGHVDECDTCGYRHPFYNSCRNRHCPTCGALERAKWLAARQADLLPVMYFHVVLTLPDDLNPMALVNQEVVYRILFRAGSETLLELGRDPKHLGGEIGVLATLHTWGQNMLDHPHLHCITTGGGLSEDGQRWVLPKKAIKKNGKRRKFFVHVNVISDLFKKKFLAYLQEAYDHGELKFVGKIAAFESPEAFKKLKAGLYAKKWVTYCKAPFGGPKQVLSYLAGYTHRVAISNHRLIKIEDGRVFFKWRDYRDGKTKVMRLEAFEFIRRFLLHVLPGNFYKIRYYGIWSSRNRKTKLKHCQELLGVTTAPEALPSAAFNWEDWLCELTGIDPRVCPKCGKGRMVTREILPAVKVVPKTG